MVGPVLLALVGGALIGLLVAVLVRKRIKLLDEIPGVSITVTCLPGNQIQINGSVDSSVPEGMTLTGLYVQVYGDPNQVVPASPPAGAASIAASSSFSIVLPLPAGRTGVVAVWAEFTAYSKASQVFSCPGSGSSGSSGFGMSRAVSAAVAEQLEAIPRAYRLSAGSPAGGAGGGPAAELVGALARTPEAVLRYIPEGSTPVEPFWRARGGPAPALEWTLRLLHRNGGFGAVLSAVCLVGGREVQFSWVTSNWRFHAANRLLCESTETGGPALLVSPA